MKRYPPHKDKVFACTLGCHRPVHNRARIHRRAALFIDAQTPLKSQLLGEMNSPSEVMTLEKP